MQARRKDIILGASIGVGIGLLLLAVIALIARPYYIAATQPPQITPSPTIIPPSATPTIPVSPNPSPTLSPTPSPTPESRTHVVQENEVLSGIAYQYGTTVEAIMAANNLPSPDLIVPGMELVIPLGDIEFPTPTAFAEGEAIIHTVISGETLSGLAQRYSVTVESIQSANGLTSEAIQAGQELVIPTDEAVTELPTSEPYADTWQFSVLEGNLSAAYPLTMETDRFTVHYQPNSLPAQRIDRIIGMVQTSLDHIESTLQIKLEGRFDVYVAGSLFAPPNLSLRGRSFSSQRRFFFLYDDTGTPDDRQYILTHENTHTMTWNTMGRPISVMLHEGVAVYTGMTLVGDKGYLPINKFCAAYHQTGQLPRVSGHLSFQGHIRDLDTYYTAGCFVQYLIEQYGPEKFAEVYHTGNYTGIYGQSLADIEADWIAALEAANYSLSFNPDDLVYYVEEVGAAYDRLFTGFTVTETQMEAYQELDRARIALLQGHLNDVEKHLTVFENLLLEG